MSAWQFACPDWQDRLRSGRTLLPDLPLDRGAADLAVNVYNNLRLPDVPDRPLLRDVGADWFREIVAAVFGSLDRASGVRRVSSVFVLVPKKNSKTTNGAALMLTGLILNRRPEAPFGLFGPTQEVAQRAYDSAAGMIEADDALKRLLRTRDHLKTIEHRTMGGSLKVTTFDPAIATGGKLAGWLLDELHLLGRSPYAAKVLGDLRGARVAIPEQFGVVITTQSTDAPAGVFKQELDYARAVRDGRVASPSVLPVLYEFPEDVQTDKAKPWSDPRSWHIVNPNWGRSVNAEILEQDHDDAVIKGPVELRRWASQHLNIEIGLALHSDRWRGADYWIAATDAALTLDELLERSEVCVVGIDGGGLDDLFGLAVIGRDRETKDWLLWTRAWCHPDVLEERKEIAARLGDFQRDGDLVICERPTQDIEDVADIVEMIAEAGLLAEENAVGLDPVGIAALVDELASRGVTAEQLRAIPQGYMLTGAINGAERKLKDGTFRHGGQALMAWCVGNAKVEQRGNAVLITKQAAGKAKIDPLVATLNAVALMSKNPQARAGKSVFEVMAEQAQATSDDAPASPVAQSATTDDDAILSDPAHPQWQAARERFEARFAMADDDDEVW